MKRNDTINWDLVAKKLAGETGTGEEAELQTWLDQSHENRKVFDEIRTDWKKMDQMEKQFNVDRAWNKVHQRIAVQDGMPVDRPAMAVPRRTWMTPMRLAASFLLVALLGTASVYISYRMKTVTVTTASNDRQRSVSLPDGSVVTLNADSRISYSKEFNRNRNVNLTGEAFFEVAPDKQHPFVIHADKADIRVVGTSFNVKTDGGAQGVQVYVSTGVVEMFPSGSSNNRVTLHPGDIGLLSAGSVSSHKSRNANSIAWKTGEMDFRDTRLSDAVEVLNQMYGVNIICQEPGMDTILTNGTYRYPDESLDKILEILCTQNTMKARKEDHTIYLSR